MEGKLRFFQARLESRDGDLVHLLISDSRGRKTGETAKDVMEASFLSSWFKVPVPVHDYSVKLTELDEANFSQLKGHQIPSDEIAGLTFWWHRTI